MEPQPIGNVHKPSGLPIIILIILVLFSIGLATYFYYLNFLFQKQLNSLLRIQQLSPALTSTQLNVDQAHAEAHVATSASLPPSKVAVVKFSDALLKPVSVKKEGFSLKIPTDWDIVNNRIGPRDVLGSLNNEPAEQKHHLISFFVRAGDGPVGETSKLTNTRINGYVARKVILPNWGPYAEVIFPLDYAKFLIFIIDDPELEDFLDEILATITIDKTGSVEPIRMWEVFSQENIPFTFRYPKSKFSFNYSAYTKNNQKASDYQEYKKVKPIEPTSVINSTQLALLPTDKVLDIWISIYVFTNIEHLNATQWFERYEYYPVETNQGGEVVNPPTKLIDIGGVQGGYAEVYGQEYTYITLIPYEGNMYMFYTYENPSERNSYTNQIVNTTSFQSH